MEEEDQEDVSKFTKFINSWGKAREAERQEEAATNKVEIWRKRVTQIRR